MMVFLCSHLVSLLELQFDGKNNLVLINSTLWLLTLMVVISFSPHLLSFSLPLSLFYPGAKTPP